MFPSPQAIVSVSRDATVRFWKNISSSPPRYDSTITSQSSSFINAVAYIPPTEKFPNGLIVSGGKDTVIEVREPSEPADKHAERLLPGHANNVCALDVNMEGGYVVSGSWDATARIWSMGKWECEAVLEEHPGNVWAVLAYDKETILTACVDGQIRIFTTTGKLFRSIKGPKDILRALCKLPSGHASGADFASAGNEGIIRLWTLDGRQVAELHGHDNFIYSLACTPDGDLVSSGEDRTVRIWRNNECIQTITHPAISVWSVAVCAENGDIASGASDRIARVFTRDSSRHASPDVIRSFEESVKASAIPAQQAGEINKEKLPGPEFLTQKSGTKEGQVAMIKEADGNVVAYSWSTATREWIQVGTVVDSAASSGRRQTYRGKEYDYVFDVDIEEGQPPLKLPYNLAQNPYEVAMKFVQEHEMSMNYLDQVANFITENTKGTMIGSATSSAPPPPSELVRPKILPQKTYLSIMTASFKAIQKKLEELNTEQNTLSADQVTALRSLTNQLEKSPSSMSSASAIRNSLGDVLQLMTTWPASHLLPALDLFRIMVGGSPTAAMYRTPIGDSIVEILASAGALSDPDRPNNIMLAIRAFVNLFETDAGQQLADTKFDKIYELIKQVTKNTNRNVMVAISTLYVNYAVQLGSKSASEPRARLLLEDLVGIIASAVDSEVLYRALVAAGQLRFIGCSGANSGLEEALKRAEERVKETRIRAVIKEIRDIDN